MIDFDKLKEICKLIRYNILTSTTGAGSGHPTSSLSAVELTVVLFFTDFFKKNDKFILSKGHASPLLYSLYQAARLISRDELMTLRQFNSPLEGHPTPRLSYIDVATGTLGQGLSIGVGMALGFKKKGLSTRTYVLLGDSEMAEGQNYEAMEVASYYKLGNLVAILDVNRLGQRGETMLGWDVEKYAGRVKSFGWNTVIIQDGHDLEEIYNAYQSRPEKEPTMFIAKTIKGKGISLWEDKNGFHGVPLKKDELEQALKELGKVDLNIVGKTSMTDLRRAVPMEQRVLSREGDDKIQVTLKSTYKLGDTISTREAYGDALTELGKIYPAIVALDAEVSNSTFSKKFGEQFPDRFFEMFIAEQNMVSAALGLSKVGFTPFVSTFAVFFTRTLDQIRMIELSQGNVKFVGSHAGVHIGQDGPSQMGLEDLSMFRSVLTSIVLYPADAIATFKLIQEMVKAKGIVYLRTNREKTPIIYNPEEEFQIGGSKVLFQSEKDKVVVVGAGITLHEAIKAYKKLKDENISIAVVDLYSIKPIDSETLLKLARKTKNFIVVEDHYPAGGIGEAVKNVLCGVGVKVSHLAVTKVPRSGLPDELLHYEEIDSEAIIKTVKQI